MDLDRYLRLKRMEMAKKEVRPATRVLDIGCYDGEFLKNISGMIKEGVGLDPLAKNIKIKNVKLKNFTYKRKLPFKKSYFDDIYMLATIEHIDDQKGLAKECYRILKNKGRVIITVPSKKADFIIDILMKLGILHEIDFFKQHKVPTHEEIVKYFCDSGFILKSHKKFQLGLNNVYVWKK